MSCVADDTENENKPKSKTSTYGIRNTKHKGTTSSHKRSDDPDVVWLLDVRNQSHTKNGGPFH